MKMTITRFLNHYKEIFTDSGLKKITGLNSKQIEDYATGKREPTVAKLKKIENAIHCFGQEILEDVEIRGVFEINNSKCPNCGFDFSKIKPQLELYLCECRQSQADITQHYIRIISNIAPIETRKKSE